MMYHYTCVLCKPSWPGELSELLNDYASQNWEFAGTLGEIVIFRRTEDDDSNAATIPDLVKQASRLSAIDRRILIFLEAYHNEHQYMPTLREIAAEVGYSWSTLNSHLWRMAAMGFLHKERHASRGFQFTDLGHKLLASDLPLLQR